PGGFHADHDSQGRLAAPRVDVAKVDGTDQLISLGQGNPQDNLVLIRIELVDPGLFGAKVDWPMEAEVARDVGIVHPGDQSGRVVALQGTEIDLAADAKGIVHVTPSRG